MKQFLGVTMAVALVALMAGAAVAYGPRGMMGHGDGPMMGAGQGGQPGPGWMGGGAGNCPGFAGASGAPGTAEPRAAITDEKAKELATVYVDKYLKGFTVERVLPFTMRAGTMYQVELQGPKGEQRVLHVSPWGAVRPFGPVGATE